MANGTRNDSIQNQDIDLYYNFLQNGALFDAYSFDKVEIYPTYADAQAETNIIETIQGTGNITNISTGRYSYTASGIATIGTYYDKVYITPTATANQFTDINPFYVRQEVYGGATPGTHEKVRIYINVFDILDNAEEDVKAVVRMNVPFAYYGTDIIKQSLERYESDSTGQIVMDLVETDTLTEDTYGDTGDDRIVHYSIEIGKKYTLNFTVPRGTVSANLLELPVIHGE